MTFVSLGHGIRSMFLILWNVITVPVWLAVKMSFDGCLVINKIMFCQEYIFERRCFDYFEKNKYLT